MAVFAYKAVDARQRPESGTITADTAPLARQALRSRGWAVVDVTALRPKSVRHWWPRRSARRSEQVAELWRNLAVLLAAGVPLAEALTVCQRQLRGPLLAVVRQVEQTLRGGQVFSQALALHPRLVRPLDAHDRRGRAALRRTGHCPARAGGLPRPPAGGHQSAGHRPDLPRDLVPGRCGGGGLPDDAGGTATGRGAGFGRSRAAGPHATAQELQRRPATLRPAAGNRCRHAGTYHRHRLPGTTRTAPV